MPSASPRSFVSCTDSVNSRPGPRSWSRWKRPRPPRRALQYGQVAPSHEGRGDFMATATAEAPETVRAPFFTTKVITFIAFTATLIFSQNMFAVSSQIGVGDWEFWIDWKDYAWAPFVYTWIVAVHFPVYSWIFNKFFKLYFGSTLVLMFWFLQRTLMIQLLIPMVPIPSYIAEGFTWPLPYISFYGQYIIMTGFMGIMGVVWSGFTYIFLKSIFYGYEKTIKHFVKPAGA